MDVDEALASLGKWGKWQMTFYIIICIVDNFPAVWHMLSIVFLGGIPEHHCKLDEGMDVNTSIPINSDGILHECAMYANASIDNSTIACTQGWHYYGDVGSTIASEFDLVCHKSYMVETSQTVMIVGVMLGAMLFSAISDNYGRKPTFLFSQWALLVVGIATAFVHNYYFFTVLRFFAGALQQGIVLTGFILACELFPAKQRTFAGMFIELFWAGGMCIMALFAYLIRDWRYLQLCITIPGVVTIGLYWILPESIPWLCANNRSSDAEVILRKAAKFNGTALPAKLVHTQEQDYMLQDGTSDKEKKTKENGGFLSRFKKQKEKKEPDTVARYTLIDVFKHAKLRMYSSIMCLVWLVNGLVYYGLSLSTGELAGDRYLNFFLSGLVEIPAYLTCLVVLQRWGRRWPLAIFHIIAGVALVLTMFIPKKTGSGVSLVPLIMVFNMIGKFGITGSFGTIFLYTPEIFPTTVRNQAMGLSSLGGRVGNMLAPFSSYVARILPWLPGSLFGILSILVGLLALLLPETLNRPLPQSIEDVDAWTRTGSRKLAPVQRNETVELSNDMKAGKDEMA